MRRGRQRVRQRSAPLDDPPPSRNRVERFVNRMKHSCRVATRYDKLDQNYQGFFCLAALFVGLN
ncbi:MAG: transposase [Planctomycetaceae bacterium]|nr:transposase [Planctomycetaceae bacterium]